MAFRADEERAKGMERAINRLVPRGLSPGEREKAISKLYEIEEEYGPVVQSYPSWHPLMKYDSGKLSYRRSHITPGRDNGYAGVDNTIYFVNAFITCPYDGGAEIIEAVKNRKQPNIARINAEVLDEPFYNTGATPVLISCEWHVELGSANLIPKRTALGLMLEDEIPQWRDAEVAETWDSMRSYFFGSPHGAKSSLFVDQDTGQRMKTVWNAVINTGLYGPIKV